MGNKRRTAAIFAGLSGCGVWSIPVLASAAPLDSALAYVDVTMDDLLASPVAYFAVGVLVGGGVVGLAMGLARHHATKRLRLQLTEATSEPLVIRIQEPGHVLDLDVAPVPAAEAPVPVPAPVEEDGTLPDDDSTTADLGRVHGLPEDVMPAMSPEPAPAPVAHGVTDLGEPRMARPAHVSARLDALLPSFDDEALPPRPTQAARPAGTHAPAGNGYAAVAESYVRGEGGQGPAATPAATTTVSERSRRRSRGVRSVLSERLGNGIMDGLPVIERADGSTADIGTSWWEKEVGSTHSFAPLDSTAQLGMVPVNQAGDPMATSELRLRELARAERNARVAGLSSAGTFGGLVAGTATSGPATDRSATIASRIPSFDLSLYPDEDDGQSTSGEDMFEQAMRALDAQLPAAGVTTSEDAASITAPLSSDLKTGYVVTPESLAGGGAEGEPDDDISAHVDYLVRDEMERRHAQDADDTRGGTHHHSFLTVFEGTGDLSDARKAGSARHLAEAKTKREA